MADTLDHSVEIRIPTQCGDCKKALPEQIRAPLLDEAKRDFGKWFGGFEVTHKHGGYTFPDGTLAEEEVDVVESSCSEEALEEHLEDLAVFAVRVANELSQDSVALSIDGRMRFYDRTPGTGKCLHAKKSVAPAIPSSVPNGREAKTVSEKLQALYAALDSFSSLDTAKYVFRELLSYDPTDESLPWRDWPRDLKERLSAAPQVFAYAKGFKIVYLRQSSGQLSRGTTRAVISRILRDNANSFYGLFVVSNDAGDTWKLVNARLADGKANRLILRRIPVGTGEGARTVTERLQLVDLDGREKLSAQEIQALHDSAFDVEGISKEFYQKIAAWYFWAQNHKGVNWPRSVSSDADQSIFFIRMLTRLIFCWFMRAKGLIPEKLFDLKFIKENLKDSKKDEGAYYKAILQNLFFATLNREINDRSFQRKNDKGLDGNYGVTTLYCYADLMKNSSDMLALFKKVPFVNGGLFECLDDTTKKPEVRFDDFSEHEKNKICIPDELFFGRECEIDLSGTYGDKKHKKDSVAGLINILNHYQFTVEENTPLDQAVALDPELLGKVFENLLASYNEETKTTARKALGAFYTPREIVDYMVDESLLAYLKGKLPDTSEEKLRGLLAYNYEPHGLSDDDVETLITAIDHLKALDPAVGSGAFPMGMLHKLVHVLGKLDPGNEKWKQKQIEKMDGVELREQAERTFRENPADYSRKLYLIENSIYGVDIQPVAIQIAKMRFFISLIVDQKQTEDAERNYGILALPNLETNFVAANTLIAIDRPKQLSLRTPDIEKKEKELHRVRQDHFNAKTPKTKAKCRENDEKLRAEIAELLKHEVGDDKTAKMLAHWNPYDQNTFSEFFNLQWMFGIDDGVDIVIGNPPWIQSKVLSAEEKRIYSSTFRTAIGQYDLFNLFIEKGVALLKSEGRLIFITPDRFITNIDYRHMREYLLKNTCLRELTSLGDDVFENVAMPSAIIHTENSNKRDQDIRCRSYFSSAFNIKKQEDFMQNDNFIFKIFGDFKIDSLLKSISDKSEKIADHLTNARGVEVGKKSDAIVLSMRKGLKKFLRGEDIDRYAIKSSVFIDVSCSEIDYKDDKLYQGTKVLVRKTGSGIIAVIDDEYRYVIQTIYIFKKKQTSKLNERYVLACLNSKLINFFYNYTFGEKDRKIFPHLTQGKVLALPIRNIYDKDQKPFISLVEQILAVKKANYNVDTTALEKQIDELVYKLYDLTAEEIAIIEGKDY